jgi:hypothetical protein
MLLRECGHIELRAAYEDLRKHVQDFHRVMPNQSCLRAVTGSTRAARTAG